MNEFIKSIKDLNHNQLLLLADSLNNEVYSIKHLSNDIAIIGMDGNFPCASNLETYWRKLKNSCELITEFTIEEIYNSGTNTELANEQNYIKAKPILSQIDKFDAEFFKFTPREAELLDPQQRIFFECVWRAFENANCIPENVNGNIGIFAGKALSYYEEIFLPTISENNVFTSAFEQLISNDKDYLATHIAYKLNLKGPSLSIQTACSTSLVAIDEACRSLQENNCDIAIAGGVAIHLPQISGYLYEEGAIMSRDGHCRPFDAEASGTVFGDGAGVVVLKRLDQALADGDQIHAVIKGSATNNDGASKVGFTAPSAKGQAEVIAMAQAKADVHPDSISYIEAHGTGTSLGDPIEVSALTEVFRSRTDQKQFCALGSVKSNVGHLETAAGIAGLIKTVLALKHKQIPPTLHFNTPNPEIDLDNSPFYINTELEEWKSNGTPRRAGVSSFGIGGTNAHVILEEAPEIERKLADVQRPHHLLTLSAKNDPALHELVQRYLDHSKENEQVLLEDISYTSHVGRAHFDHRLSVVCDSHAQLQQRLTDFLENDIVNGIQQGQTHESATPAKIVFLFTGQGSQYAGMGQQLYATAPVFKEAIDTCSKYLEEYLDHSLQSILWGEHTALLDQTQYTQPALFALEYALARLWQSWGIAPTAVLGHSIGEYVAACIAEVFSLADAIKLIAARARLMQALPQDGCMISVLASEQQLQPLLAPHQAQVSFAAINGPESVVISGETQVIEAITTELTAEDIKTKPLTVSHAFHSPLMEPMLEEFAAIANSVQYQAPQLDFISNVSGTLAQDEVADPAYWVRHIRQPVRFAQGIQGLADPSYLYIEIGPQPVLLGMARQCLSNGEEHDRGWLPSLRSNREDWEQLLDSLGYLYIGNQSIDWEAFDRDYLPRKTTLPTYPFQRQRYWIEANPDLQRVKAQSPILQALDQGDTQQLVELVTKNTSLTEEKRQSINEALELLSTQYKQQQTSLNYQDWTYEIIWKEEARSSLITKLPSVQQSNKIWLIFCDQQNVGKRLAQELYNDNIPCIVVTAGNRFKRNGEKNFVINPSNVQDYEKLLQTIDKHLKPGEKLEKIIYLWGLDVPSSTELTSENLDAIHQSCYASALHLSQALVKQNQNAIQAQLWMLTQGVIPIEASPTTISIAQAPLWGLGKVFALEHPNIWGGLLDIDPEASNDDVKAFIDDLRNEQDENQIAYRNKKRYIARLAPIELNKEKSKELVFSPDATYVISGGLGALGLETVRWLASAGATHLALISRSKPNKQAQIVIDGLKETDTQIQTFEADVTDINALTNAFNIIVTSMPPVKGIIHAAGINGDLVPLQSLLINDFNSVLKAKTLGTWNLHQLTKELSLDFFICFSSIASIWGSVNQSHYAAANQFLDSFSHYRHALNLPALTINWGPWSTRDSNTEESRYQQLAQIGVKALPSRTITKMLHTLFSTVAKQVVVADIEWDKLKTIYNARKLNLLFANIGIGSKTTLQTSTKQSSWLDELQPLPEEQRQLRLTQLLQQALADLLGFPNIEKMSIEKGFFDIGMDSLMAIELRNRIQSLLGCKLSETMFFDYPNIKKLRNYIAKTALDWTFEGDANATQELSIISHQEEKAEPLAIIGISYRFPGNVSNATHLWNILENGKNVIEQIPIERWDIDNYYDPDSNAPGKMYIRRSGVVHGLDLFDPEFFNISPKETKILDPHQRLLLEVSWEALEQAAINTSQLKGSKTGVFIGISNSLEYLFTRDIKITDDLVYAATGNPASTAAGRISYSLGLIGPCLAIDTACSSALTAIQQASQSLRTNECNLAIAGGANLLFSPLNTVAACKANMLAPDGHCKTFDASADGYVRSEGCGALILKRLSDALADEDPILAIIRGSAINQDGASSGLTVPNGPAQETVIRKALAESQINPSDISYIEAHGTGTPLGDPIEIGALASVFAESHDKKNPLAIGSIKTNIGHLEAAAGMAGLAKVVLALQHKTIPAHLHFKNPSPHIPWDDIPIRIPTKAEPWETNGKKRIAGVSAFGFSGTNAHVILEEAPEVERKLADVQRPHHLLTLSAKNDAALHELVQRYLDHSKENEQVLLEDISYTSHVGRAHFDHRLSVVCDSHAQLQQRLTDFLENDIVNGIQQGQTHESATPAKIVFLFTGQGSQYAGMGQQLYATAPVFKEAIDTCSKYLEEYLDHSLQSILWGEHTALLDQTQYTQPALFALEYALARLWQSWGIAPTAVLGHSIGEYVAACIAEVFSLADAIKLIAARARLMQALPQDGCMISVLASEQQLQPLLAPHQAQVSFAAINGPESVVISGETQVIEAITTELTAEDIKTKPLTVSHAFHSPLMEPMLEEFAAIANSVQYQAPQLDFISNVSGTLAQDEVADPAYWVRHIRQPVRFAQGIQGLADPSYLYIEIGPQPVLLGMARQCLSNGEEHDRGWLPSLRSNREDWEQLLDSLGYLYIGNQSIDWEAFDRDYLPRKTTLPTYPFQRQRYWIEAKDSYVQKSSLASKELNHPLLGHQIHSPIEQHQQIIQFQSTIQSNSPAYLNDHQVFDQVLFPGTGYVEIALAAGAEVFTSESLILEDVAIEQPLVLEPKQHHIIQVLLYPDTDAHYRFEIYSLVDDDEQKCEWTLHASGRISSGNNIVDEPINISALQNEFNQELPVQPFYDKLHTSGLNYGSSFRAIQQLYAHEQTSLAHIQLSNHLHEENNSSIIHPALLDGCLQAFGAALPGKEIHNTYLPVGFKRLQIHQRNLKKVLLHAQLDEDQADIKNISGNFAAYTDSGECAFKVEGLHYREASLEQFRQQETKKWLHQINWERHSSSTEQQDIPLDSTQHWLIFADQHKVSASLVEQLAHHAVSYTLVYAGERFNKNNEDEFEVQSTEPEQVLQLIETLSQDDIQVTHVVYAWGVDSHSVIETDSNVLSLDQRHQCTGLLSVIQGLVQLKQEIPPRFVILTQQAVQVDQEPLEIHATQSTLWGFHRVLPQEHPELQSVCIDLDHASFEQGDNSFIDALLTDLATPSTENQIAYRNGQRYVARLGRYQATTNTPQTNIHSDASYLITGGLGGLGLEAAKTLAAAGAKHLILLGRSAPSEDAQAVIETLQENDVYIHVLSVDIADFETLTHAFDTIASSMPPLKGILHAAGVLDDGVITQQSWSRFEKVYAPKVQGAWNLHALTQKYDLDFFVCFSSTASALGSAGQSNYAAANAFMDGLMQARHQTGLPGLSINWGAWAEAGMAASLDASHQQRIAASGLSTIPLEQGMQLLLSLLNKDLAQLTIVPFDWNTLQIQFGENIPTLYEHLVQPKVESTTAKQSSWLDELQPLSEEQREARLIQLLQGTLAKTLGLSSPEHIDPERDFFDLGLDSLMAIELRNVLQTSLECTLSTTILFDHSNCNLLTEYILVNALENKPKKANINLPSLIIDSEALYAPFPLTDVQQAYWVGRRGNHALGNVGTHAYIEIKSENLDVARYEQALQRVIERHEMLRVKFLPDGTQQFIQDIPEYHIKTTDFHDRPQQEAETFLAAERERLSHQVFDTDTWPLFEFTATKLDEKLTHLHISIDLIIVDAWSTLLLFSEISRFYNDPNLSLSKPEISFRDYVLTEQAFRDSDTYQQSLIYWQDRLNTFALAPELPLRVTPDSIDKPTFARQASKLEADVWNQLKQRAKHIGLTPSVVLLTAYAQVLASWSKQQTFTVNLTFFNRLPLHPEINSVIGDFTSLILLECDCSSGDAFTRCAKRLQQQLWNDLDHADVSGVQMLRELSKTYKSTVTMPVVFTSTLVSNTKSKVDLNDLIVIDSKEPSEDVVYSISQTPQVWLDHQVYEQGEELYFLWDSVEGLFPDGLLSDMFNAYCELLNQLARDDALWDQSVQPTLLPHDHQALIQTVNQTQAPQSDQLLHQLFNEAAQQFANNPAVISSSKTLTYAELYQLSHQLAHQLHTFEVQANQLIAIVMHKGWEQIVGALSILHAGAAYVPIDPSLPHERLLYLLEQCDVSVVLTQTAVDNTVTWPEHITCLCVDQIAVSKEPVTPVPVIQSNEDLAYVIFTSGSTGVPKGVMIDHKGAVNTIVDINQRFNVTCDDRVLALSALNFDLSVYDVFGSLAAGGAIVLPDADKIYEPAHWLSLLENEHVTIWNTVPALLGLLIEYTQAQQKSLPNDVRLALLSGDWIPLSLPEQIKSQPHPIELISLGGATEASIWSILYPIEQVAPDWTSVPYGKPMRNQQFYVLNDQLEHCPIWVSGQLYIGGIGLAKGYWKDQEKTDASFIIHPITQERLYKTGDLGRYLPDGNIEFLGREDFQVKVQGHRIELGEIETTLETHTDIRTAIVNAIGERLEDKRLAAYIVMDNESTINTEELHTYLSAKLPHYMVPNDYICIDEVPLTPNGKVDRTALTQRHPIAVESEPEDSAPESAIEEQLIDIIQNELNVKSVNTQQNFFELGLTSIQLIRLHIKLEELFQLNIKATDLFNHPTIRGLASKITLYKENEKNKNVLVNLQEYKDSKELIEQSKLIRDPEQRESFKKKQLNIRAFEDNKSSIYLKPNNEYDKLGYKNHTYQKSIRKYSADIVSFEHFSNFISCLKQYTRDEGPKYLYASAGGLYPIQTYVYIKPHRVERLEEGVYYYNPKSNSLTSISSHIISAQIHEPFINKPIYESSAFSIFFVADYAAIEPLYGSLSPSFCKIEAGIISQLLTQSAYEHHLGLCHIGGVDFEQISSLFALNESHELIHSMVGGLRTSNDIPSYEVTKQVDSQSDIAIIGVSGKFPQAPDIETYWDRLAHSDELITFFNDDELHQSSTDGELLHQANYVKAKPVLNDTDQFDAQFFEITPQEATVLDPQQRIFLECVWEALEDSGYIPTSSNHRFGIFAGKITSQYERNHLPANDLRSNFASAFQQLISNGKDYLAAYTSYKLNLRGPSLSIQTACSTSLVAIDEACRSLQENNCDIAIAGGVALQLMQQYGYFYEEGAIMSRDGHCRPFDAEASGTVFGDGAGVVVLKRLDQALADGDQIHAVIKGSATNNDGASKVGFTAPSAKGQAEVIAMAQAKADVHPDSISYIEAHGTGTSLGDPIEVSALTEVFRSRTDQKQFCALGSVKSNVGHLETAAGIAGLIKTVLALKHKQIPPTLHFNTPNPEIDLDNSPFYINTELEEWKSNGTPRRAGVSSFGIGGTNAHVILEEAPEVERKLADVQRPHHLLTLSAKNDPALHELVQRYLDHSKENEQVLLEDISYTSHVGRAHFDHRLSVVCDSHAQLQQRLTDFLENDIVNGIQQGQTHESATPAKIVFLFTGQGSQYAGMGQQLYATAPVFKEAIDTCAKYLEEYLDHSLQSILWGEHTALLDQTQYTQPALFALEYALARLWQSWGIAPTAVLGHSIGEYVAACIAEVFSLADALKLIAARGRLMQALPQDGCMVSVLASEQRLQPLLAPHQAQVSFAAINGPESVVISGETQVIEAITTELTAEDIKTKPLTVSHAFHSPLMEPMLEEFAAIANSVQYQAPRLDFISNVSGTLAQDEVADPAYWVQHIRQPVRFAQGIQGLADPSYLYIEIGPQPVLLGMARQCLSNGEEHDRGWLPSLRSNREDWEQLLDSLGYLYIGNQPIDWEAFDRDYLPRKTTLPTYPFQRQRYWIEANNDRRPLDQNVSQEQTQVVEYLNQGNIKELVKLTSQQTAFSDLDEEKATALLKALVQQHRNEQNVINTKKWLHQINWERHSSSTEQQDIPLDSTQHWLIFADQHKVSASLVEQLAHHAVSYTLVYAGERFNKNNEDEFEVQSTEPEQVLQLIETLSQDDIQVTHVVYAWGVDSHSVIETDSSVLSLDQRHQCTGLLSVIQGLVQLKQEIPPRFVILTQQAVQVDQEPLEIHATQSTLWGFHRVLPQEHPELQSVCIDLDHASFEQGDNSFIDALLTDLATPSTENQIAYRNGQRYVARLGRYQATTNTPQTNIHSDASYLITGGLGGLGLEAAKTLAAAGAKHLILLGRSAPSEDAQAVIETLQENDVYIHVLSVDIADFETLTHAFDTIASSMPPLKGILHAAGVLDDGVITQQSWSRFEKVYAPKVQGAWNLHALTQKYDLDFFVCFSSTASALGSAGQSNYAAANAFMDGLMQARHQTGLPGLSINWGAWAEAGMAASLDASHQQRIAASGLSTIPLEQGMQLLLSLLNKDLAQLTIVPFDWNTLQSQFGENIPTLYEHLVQPKVESTTAKQSSWLDELQPLSEEQREARLIQLLQGTLAKTLGLSSPEHIDPERDFFDLGLDSLMAIELRNVLQTRLRLSLSNSVIFDNSNIVNLSKYLHELIDLDEIEVIDSASPIPTILRTENLPLSFAQQRLWLLDQIEQDSAFYNAAAAYTLKGKLSSTALAQALNYIIDRHEALRTFFTEDDQGNPQQIIVDKLTVTTPVIDLSDDPEQDKKAFTLCQQEAMLPFNLSEAPLLRSKILKLNEEQHVLILVMHHTITDGWSMNLFIQELTTCYQAFCEQTQPQLPTLPVQYTDYAQWQRQWLQTGIAETQLDYWKQQLADAPTLLKLPTDYPRPAIETHRGTFHTFALSSEQTQQFNSLCQRGKRYFVHGRTVTLQHLIK